jgi:hypothetical protein
MLFSLCEIEWKTDVNACLVFEEGQDATIIAVARQGSSRAAQRFVESRKSHPLLLAYKKGPCEQDVLKAG